MDIAVIGSGTMGNGIAHVSALAGHTVRLFDISETALQAGLDRIRGDMQQGVDRKKLAPELMAEALPRIQGTTSLEEACRDAGLVIEAVPEKLELKQGLFRQAEAWTEGILASNTSSLSIARIAEGLARPERVIGLHFFNPVHIMKLLEIVVHEGTDSAVLDRCQAYGGSIGKTCITVRDFPGFATSRLGVCLGMEAIRMVEQGVASPEDIDTAMVLGYRHPIGPLRLTDLVGLDVRLHIGEYLATALGNPAFEPPQLMRRMVAEGRLGKKTGQGFYTWE